MAFSLLHSAPIPCCDTQDHFSAGILIAKKFKKFQELPGF